MSILFILFLIFAYGLGSLSSAIIISKVLNLPDPRTQGSGNPGTTNVLRVSGKLAAILVLIGDVLKGFIPIMFATLFGFGPLALAVILLAAVIGHVFPVFFDFKGGKGIATAFGGLIALAPLLALIAAIIWVAVVVVTRYVSLACIVVTLTIPILSLWLAGDAAVFIPMALMGGLILWRHRDNILRLREGTESKIKL
ncbi:glycerol-3-phosphate 1-O-acyltransferase PlsY [soil metagenome]